MCSVRNLICRGSHLVSKEARSKAAVCIQPFSRTAVSRSGHHNHIKDRRSVPWKAICTRSRPLNSSCFSSSSIARSNSDVRDVGGELLAPSSDFLDNSTYKATLTSLQSDPSLVPLHDLLSLLASWQEGHLLPVPWVETLYKALLAVPASRLVLSVLHYNHLLSHLVNPAAADTLIGGAPFSPSALEFVGQLLGDMKDLELTPTAQTNALHILALKDDPAAAIPLYDKLKSANRKQLPVFAFNVILDQLLKSGGVPGTSLPAINKRTLWGLFSAIQASTQAQPNVATYEFLLKGFGPHHLNAPESLNKVLQKLRMSDTITWRPQTFAAVLDAHSVQPDERHINRLSYQLRKARVPMDKDILAALLRCWLNLTKPYAVLRHYHQNVGKFPERLLPTPPETYAILIQACAAIPETVAEEASRKALIPEALLRLEEVHKDMLRDSEKWDNSSSISMPSAATHVFKTDPWDYLAKAFATLGEPQKALDVYRHVSTPSAGVYIPSPMMLESIALAFDKMDDTKAAEEFAQTYVFTPQTVQFYEEVDVPSEVKDPLFVVGDGESAKMDGEGKDASAVSSTPDSVQGSEEGTSDPIATTDPETAPAQDLENAAEATGGTESVHDAEEDVRGSSPKPDLEKTESASDPTEASKEGDIETVPAQDVEEQAVDGTDSVQDQVDGNPDGTEDANEEPVQGKQPENAEPTTSRGVGLRRTRLWREKHQANGKPFIVLETGVGICGNRVA
ncbi:uncharacterized protein EV422DRAFT_504634 [Fimicolochytrium jonesii]|uniref:uncharacterized protein n=1 Tax=Fimicolochytrium jonesii TaxID=1396493 RepID=UPI0022FF311F|nr:uncharacterized protein EV422DRAFT_504634 [Fimicolochytrium jonesii]KAI8823431.1 hypothetical protein EV422DRAFT_504634 [Fimicolochytrium jonesii]